MSKAQPPKKKPIQSRSKVTVESILIAAGQVLLELGPHKATTHKIAERAGVSVGTLYQYFPNKEAVFAELLRRGRQEMFATVMGRLSEFAQGDLEDIVRVGVDAMLKPFHDNPEVAAALAQHRDHITSADERREAQRPLHALLAQGLRMRDDLRAMDDPEYTALTLVKATEAVIIETVHQRPERLADGSLARELERLLVAFLR